MKNENTEFTASELKKMRLASKLSREEVARILKIPKPILKAYERGLIVIPEFYCDEFRKVLERSKKKD